MPVILFICQEKCKCSLLTHIKAKHPFYGTSAHSAKPDQMPQNVASDQVLHCLLTEVSFKIWIKMKNTTYQPLNWKWTHPIDNDGKILSAWMGCLSPSPKSLELASISLSRCPAKGTSWWVCQSKIQLSPLSLFRVFDRLSTDSPGSNMSSGGKLWLIRLCRCADWSESSLFT